MIRRENWFLYLEDEQLEPEPPPEERAAVIVAIALGVVGVAALIIGIMTRGG